MEGQEQNLSRHSTGHGTPVGLTVTALEWARSLVPQYQVTDFELEVALWERTAYPLSTDPELIKHQLEKALDSLRLR
jgi:hypothetical protein